MSMTWGERERKQEEAIFAEYRQYEREHEGWGVWRDGMVDEPTYLEQDFRVLVLLKEANAGEQEEDKRGDVNLSEILRNENTGKSTFTTTAQWIWVLQRMHLGLEPTPFALPADRDSYSTRTEFRQAMLRRAAIVNIKKTGGGRSAKWEGLNHAAWTHRHLLREQLFLYLPHLILSGGVDFQLIHFILHDEPIRIRRLSRELFSLKTASPAEAPVLLLHHPGYTRYSTEENVRILAEGYRACFDAKSRQGGD